jgi:hypothetical protein
MADYAGACHRARIRATRWAPIRSTRCCLDFSVAKEGYLTAYRWRGESVLVRDHLVHVFDFRRQIVFVKFVGTHAEYDRRT